jgi:hypothetical protein
MSLLDPSVVVLCAVVAEHTTLCAHSGETPASKIKVYLDSFRKYVS